MRFRPPGGVVPSFPDIGPLEYYVDVSALLCVFVPYILGVYTLRYTYVGASAGATQ